MTKLAEYSGCLSHLAADPALASRELLPHQDDDKDYIEAGFDPYLLDVTKLLGSKALARLPEKTQVFVGRENPYVRSRMRHTHDVVQAALLIVGSTGLNQNLSQAIALGHDIGHLPFGHHGEIALGKILDKKVSHAEIGVVIARQVERRGQGLNLTTQTLQGMLHHASGPGKVVTSQDLTQEAALVKWADKIAYVFADVNDFVRCLRDTDPELVDSLLERAIYFGQYQRERVRRCWRALVKESAEEGRISFCKSRYAQEFEALRRWIYENVYFPVQGGRSSIIDGLQRAYELLESCPEFEGRNIPVLLALLTDDEAHRLIELALDHRQLQLSQIANFGTVEIFKHLQGKEIDLTDSGIS